MGWTLTREQFDRVFPKGEWPPRTETWEWGERSETIEGELTPKTRKSVERWLNGDKSIWILWPNDMNLDIRVSGRKIDLNDEQKKCVTDWMYRHPLSALECPRCHEGHDLRPLAVATFPLADLRPIQWTPLVIEAVCWTCLGINGASHVAWIDAVATGIVIPVTP